MPQAQAYICATMSDNGNIYINDISTHVASFDTPGMVPTKSPLLHTIKSHNGKEGYALAWSLTSQHLLTGDTASRIYMTTASESGWSTSKSFTGHQSSVEDLEWSTSQQTVFASCSADGTIKIWDTRLSSTSQLSVNAHETDVNCISWNRYFLNSNHIVELIIYLLLGQILVNLVFGIFDHSKIHLLIQKIH